MPIDEGSGGQAPASALARLLSPSRKVSYALLAFLLIYATFRSGIAAAGKAFWFDELLTLVVSSQGTWNGILNALRAPLDGQPPLFYVFERLASHFTANQEIGLRLPSILAIPCTLTCVFVYVKRRSGELAGLLCALFLLISALFQYYAIEARPYSMVVACIAFAMVCYQKAPSATWAVLLAVSLALAQSLHYLSVLAMVPFGLAESIWLLKARRIRWPVWAAFVFGALPLLLHWNLIAVNRAYYGAHFWAKFHYYFLPHTYGDYLETNSRLGGGLAVFLFAGVLGAALWRRSSEDGDATAGNTDLAEGTLLAGMVALPFIGFGLTTLIHAGFTARYALCAVLGLALGFGFILSRARLGAILLFGIFVVSAVTVDEIHFWRFYRRNIEEVRATGLTVDRFIATGGHEELPIAVPDGFAYSTLVHYGVPRDTSRFVFIRREPPRDLENWTDSLDKGLQLLQGYLPLRMSTLHEFMSAHREFLVYWGDYPAGRDWLAPQLADEGHSVRLVELDERRALFLVSLGEHSSPQ